MRRLAVDAGYVVEAYREPSVSDEEWSAAFRAVAWSAAEARALRDMPPLCRAHWIPANHYPIGWVAINGKVHPWPILGVLTDSAWLESLSFRRHGLQP